MGKTIVNNNIKLKSGGGIINDATDGLSLGSIATIVATTLGEDITVSGNPLPVFLGDGADNSKEYAQRGYNYNKVYSTDGILAHGVNQILLAFKTGKYQTRLNAIKTRLGKLGSPSGNVVLNLYLADANSKPTGSILSTITMTATALTDASGSYLEPRLFTFSSPVNVDSDTEYCLVITAISASNSSNCVRLMYNTDASGEAYKIGTSSNSGSTWSVSSGIYSGLQVIGYSDYEAGKIYLSDFTEESRQRMHGFITESKVTDDAYSLQVNGSVSGFSSLVTGLDYYLNTIKNAETISHESNNSNTQFGKVSGYTRVGQTITTSNLLYPYSITFRVYRVGSPTDTVVCKIYDSVGGTLLATSEEKDLSKITTSTTGENITFTFPDVKLSPSTQYFFELERTGTTSNVDYYGIRQQSSSSYSGGDEYEDRSRNSSNDLYFILSIGDASLSKDVSSGIFLGKALSSSSLLLADFRGMIEKVSESGSYALGTTTKTFNAPVFAKKVKINFYYRESSYVFRGQVEVEKGELMKWSDYFGSTEFSFNVNWVGDTITITTNNVSGASWSATLYFFN